MIRDTPPGLRAGAGGGAVMQQQLSAAPSQLVYTRLTLYYSALVDMRWARSVHTCGACAFQHEISPESGRPTTEGAPFLCRSVHFGQCTSVRQLVAASRTTSAAAGARNGPARRVAKKVVTRRSLQLQVGQLGAS